MLHPAALIRLCRPPAVCGSRCASRGGRPRTVCASSGAGRGAAARCIWHIRGSRRVIPQLRLRCRLFVFHVQITVTVDVRTAQQVVLPVVLASLAVHQCCRGLRALGGRQSQHCEAGSRWGAVTAQQAGACTPAVREFAEPGGAALM